MPEGGTDEALDPAPEDDGVVLVKPEVVENVHLILCLQVPDT
jgi:hypothetical protein